MIEVYGRFNCLHSIMKTTVSRLELLLTIITLLDQFHTVLGVTRQITFNDYTYTVNTTKERIKWTDAESNCNNLGGNLVTIYSKQIDSLLFYLTSEPSCWIGLNDIVTEAGNTASAFVWVDGSNSTYRQFASNEPNGGNVGNGGTDKDCVDFRAGNMRESDGWDDRECDAYVKCYFCQKSGDSRGCDLIYEGSCYRAFEVSDGINWLDAQSSCAVWGGGLTSITTERENNLLYTAISDTVSNCWIGLYERDGDGMYQWVDGTALSYTNWTGSAPTNGNANDCIQMNTNGAGSWIATGCKGSSNSFICTRPSQNTNETDYANAPSISTSASGTVQNNSIILLMSRNNTVFCSVSRIAERVQWHYRSDLESQAVDKTSFATFSIQTGISSLQVSLDHPGYYSCVINTDIVYTIFVVDRASIVQIENFDSPTQQVDYTAGDTNSMLYYSHASIPDSSLRWTTDTVTDGADTQYSIEYPNPVLLSRVFSDVGAGVLTFSCFYRMSPATLVGSLQLAIKDTEEVYLTYVGYSDIFSDVHNPIFPSPQRIEISESTENVTFSCNSTECKWSIKVENAGNKTLSKSLYVIQKFSKSHSGIYGLLKTTDSGTDYSTANIFISVKRKDINSTSDSPTIVIISIVVILVFLLICLAVILITICLVAKRRKVTPFPKQSLANEIDTDTIQNNKAIEDAIELNAHCYSILNELKIEETTLIEHHSQGTDYDNIGDNPFQEDPYEEISTQYQEISEVVNQQSLPIPLDLYKTHINKLWQKEGSLLEEYESLGGKSHKHSCTMASTELNRNKNRFRLIYPYDQSRVILRDYGNGSTNSDYINASHIPGSYTKENFIAAQAPKENTVQEFWQMITENKIVNIVMVTNLVESGRRKSEEYFPLKFGESLTIGPYDIVLDTEEIMIGYTIRMMSIQFKGKTTKIKHFHFIAWPDHDVPTLYDELLMFVSKVQEGQIKTKAPILVHCSAGVGRTGTFITLYNLLAAIQQGKPISIYNIVHEMREHRPQMVQTFAQYKFIYLSVLEMLLGNTSIPTAEFMDTFNLYMQSEHEGYVSIFFQQYSELNYQCEKGFEHICGDALEYSNSIKNPIKDILPCDINRVELVSQHWPGNYINATSVDNGEFLITIHPTRETLRDFHQLIYQMEPSLVLMLCTKRELQLIEQNKSKRVVYWQSYDDPQEGNPFVLTCENTDKSAFIRNKITMKHTIDGCNRTFTQIIVNHWGNKDEPDLKKSVALLNTMLEFKKHFPTSPIIIHCVDGAGKSGVIYTVYRAIRDSTEKGYIDIFHIVKKLRNERMKSVTNLAYFVACYTLMNEYCFKVQ